MQKPGLFGMNGFMVLLLTCFSVAASAQQTGYLILIDAESKQPFTIRVGDQLFSSSGHGHLVIPRLKDSSYKLNFRFLKKNMNDQVFPVVIHQKDQGFQLKGNDSSYSLYNWQTREMIRPVIENDSSRMLEQGIKRDDGFSRLMAAVVNDTAVMYNTYSGNGFQRDSSLTAQRPTLNAERGTPNPVLSGTNTQHPIAPVVGLTANIEGPTDKGQPAAPNAQHPTPNAERTTAIPNKDSLLEVKRQEIHSKDSLNTARKTASRDSLVAARKQMAFLKDSLNTARKTFIKDSTATAKKQQLALKDSLIAARKATKDSLLAVRKAGSAHEGAVIAEKTRIANDSLMAMNRAHAVRDSLMAVENANRLRDSLARSTALRSTVHGQRSTKTSPGVKKLREVSLKISRKMVFLDIGNDGQVDTITLFVYFETQSDNFSMSPAGGKALVVQKPILPDLATVKKSPLKSKSSDTSSSSGVVPRNRGNDTAGFSGALQKKTVLKPGDATCSQVATEEDTQFLRSAILKANSEQDKISVATGAFAMKCFSVSQVRLLAGLLVSDKAKYGLMDAAHLHVADRDHFPELVDMLTDKNFQRKFLVMAEKRS
jgi:hypothetical protein